MDQPRADASIGTPDPAAALSRSKTPDGSDGKYHQPRHQRNKERRARKRQSNSAGSPGSSPKGDLNTAKKLAIESIVDDLKLSNNMETTTERPSATPTTSTDATTPNFVHTNPFAVLFPLPDQNQPTTSGPGPDQNPEPPKTASSLKQPKRPPPIVLHVTGKPHSALNTAVKSATKGAYHFKYTRSEVKIYLHEFADHVTLQKYLKEQRVPFHTYSTPGQRPVAAVLKGMPELSTDEVVKDLTEQGFKPLAVNKMKGPRVTQNMFKVDFEPSTTTMKQIRAQAGKVIDCRAYWAPYRKRGTTQCTNCQKYGHGTRFCNALPRCVKCGQGHPSRDCPKPRDTPATCANCGGNHTANYSGCPVFTQYRAKLQAAKPQPPRTFVPAPLPTVNAWTAKPNGNFSRRPAPSLEFDFPPLPSTQSRAPPTTNIPPTQAPIQAHNSPDTSDLNALMAEIRDFNEMFDTKAIIDALRTLKHKLATAKPGAEQYFALMSFDIRRKNGP